MAQVGVGTVVVEETLTSETSASGVTWSAIFAGAVTAAAISLILMMLGWAVGLGSVSPWPGSGVSLTTFGVGAAVWLIVVQWLASLLGGYMTGRLRTRWSTIGADEVFFRDTAHGFLAWAVATVFTFGLIAAIAAAGAATATVGASTVAAGAAEGAAEGAATAVSDEDSAYLVDTLFRTSTPAAAGAATAPAAATTPGSAATAEAASGGEDVRAESGRILARGFGDGEVSEADRAYLAQLVARETGLSQPDAEARVSEVMTQAEALETEARAAADEARKAAASFSLFMFFSLLIGAFIASAAAAYGGRLRDEP